jgi:hypothetical protein
MKNNQQAYKSLLKARRERMLGVMKQLKSDLKSAEAHPDFALLDGPLHLRSE